MAEDTGTHIGRRLREIRTWRGLSLRATAELAGYSESYLSLIERGERPVDKRSTLEALSGALRVAPSELTGTTHLMPGATEEHSAVRVLRLALAELDMRDPSEVAPRPLPELRPELKRVNTLRQACDFAGLSQVLPGLVRDLHAHVHQSSDEARREAHLGLVDCFEAARAASKHLGAPDLSQVAARHLRDVTDALSGAEWTGLAAWARAQAIGSTARSRALVLTQRAADDLAGELDRPEVAQVYGSLHLVATLAAATLGRFDEADAHLAEAADTATRAAETNFAHLYFGPANIEIWRVMVAVERGEGGKAVEIARALPADSLPPSAERQSALYLDVGRGLATEKATRDQAVMAFRHAEDIAPQKVRANPFVREAVTDLLRRARRDAGGRELRGMAYRMGLAG